MRSTLVPWFFRIHSPIKLIEKHWREENITSISGGQKHPLTGVVNEEVYAKKDKNKKPAIQASREEKKKEGGKIENAELGKGGGFLGSALWPFDYWHGNTPLRKKKAI